MSLDQRNADLEKRLEHNPIDQSVAVLIKDAKRRSRQILVLGISLTIDVILTVGFAFLSIQARDTAMDVQRSKDTIVNNCKVGNEFRATQAALWDHILNLQSISNDLTPEQQVQRDKTLAEFRKYLDTTFAPRDCSKIIKK